MIIHTKYNAGHRNGSTAHAGPAGRAFRVAPQAFTRALWHSVQCPWPCGQGSVFPGQCAPARQCAHAVAVFPGTFEREGFQVLLGPPAWCKLAHALLGEYSCKQLVSAQLLESFGTDLAFSHLARRHPRARRGVGLEFAVQVVVDVRVLVVGAWPRAIKA